MKTKKSQKANTQKLRMTLFLFGFCLTMSTVYAVFNLKAYRPSENAISSLEYDEEILEVINTVHPKPKSIQRTNLTSNIVIVEEPVVSNPATPIAREPSQREEEEIDFDNEEDWLGTLEVVDDHDYEFYEVSQKATFLGENLQLFLNENMNYPEQAVDEGIEGKVMLYFIVEKDGSISNVSVLGKRRLGFGLEKEALRVIKATSGMWSPAEQRDHKVRMKYRIPISFKLR